MIEPEAVPPAPLHRRRRRAVLAGVTVLAVVAGGIAVAAGGHRGEPAPLALLAGDAAAEKMVAPAAAPAVASADSRSFAPYPYGGSGLTFTVDGALPDLPGRAAAWTVSGPTLDRAAVVRIAGALGLTGTPVQRDGGWAVDGGDWTLAATPAGDTWSVSYYRSRFEAVTAGAAAVDSAGPSLSQAEAERRAQDLIDHMGAPAGTWKVETTETDVGVGWACAAAAGGPVLTDGELTKLEADKPRPQDPVAGNGSAPDTGVAACPPPPAPVKGFNVGLYPVLDGRRADWAVWDVTLRSDGRVENLNGSWVTFERGSDYRLRGVDVALKELTAAPEPPSSVRQGIAVDLGAPAVGVPTPAIAPLCPQPMPMPMPMPAEKATSSLAPTCPTRAPQAITITGVELGLIEAPVFEGGQARLRLVPAYRFVGHFDGGTPWETSVIALHPDAIAPPPDLPVVPDVREGGGVTGIGKAVPPTPAATAR